MYFYLQNTRYLLFNNYKKFFKATFNRFTIPSFFYSITVTFFLILGFSFFLLDTALIIIYNIIL